MGRLLQDIEEEILQLSIEDRGELTARLLESLEPSEPEIQKQWIVEAEARAAAVRAGQVEALPVGEVLSQIRAKLS